MCVTCQSSHAPVSPDKLAQPAKASEPTKPTKTVKPSKPVQHNIRCLRDNVLGTQYAAIPDLITWFKSEYQAQSVPKDVQRFILHLIDGLATTSKDVEADKK